jgi:hypothetical protein
MDSYTLQLQRHGLDSVEREVRWLSELIETERVARAPKPPDGTSGGDPPPTGAVPGSTTP